MKLLFDQNLSFRLCTVLKDLFPGSRQVRLLSMEHAEDSRIWEYARQNDFVIVTLDADFYELSLLRGAPPKIIWLRCGNQPTAVVAELLRKHSLDIKEFISDAETTCMEIYE
jgi:predicted nuclease of predicted toxin-antitoxin system